MLTLVSLPTEILLSIIDVVVQCSTMPSIGYDAAWVQAGAFRHRNNPFETAVNAWDKSVSDLATLQKVNRLFHELCLPFMFQELNLMGRYLEREELILKRLPEYAQHVRTFRFLLNPKFDSEDDNQIGEKYITDILSMCTNITSLSIYYQTAQSTQQSVEVSKQIFDILTQTDRTPLKSIGIYSTNLLISGSYSAVEEWTLPFLGSLSSSLRLRNHVQYMDLVIQNLPPYPLPVFPSLTSLTLRHSWSSPVTVNWSMHQVSQWIQQSRLVRLQLINCKRGYAADIPECVLSCPSLQYLVVSACGAFSDPVPKSRSPGWSEEHDALNKHRSPLVSFTLEHSNGWEVLALGIIPTLHLIVGSAYGGDFWSSFVRDKELFPHLMKLSIPRKMQIRDDGEVNESRKAVVSDLEKFCEERGISLDYEAQALVNPL